MMYYDKDNIKQSLTVEQVFNFVEEFGGEPEYTSFGLISTTICHNLPQEGSRKLYYYDNTKLFRCYTGCDSFFDIFELYIKIKQNQSNIELSLFESIEFIAGFFGFSPIEKEEDNRSLKDWEILNLYEKKSFLIASSYSYQNIKYNNKILEKMLYPRISLWEKEGIGKEIIKENRIGYYPVDNQITIPHYDVDNNFIGLRGRNLSQQDIDLYGKYRPVTISKVIYKHPLGRHLYNLNRSKNNIKLFKKAIIFEGKR